MRVRESDSEKWKKGQEVLFGEFNDTFSFAGENERLYITKKERHKKRTTAVGGRGN